MRRCKYARKAIFLYVMAHMLLAFQSKFMAYLTLWNTTVHFLAIEPSKPPQLHTSISYDAYYCNRFGANYSRWYSAWRGGGLIRDFVSYAAILNKPIKIVNVRANRNSRGWLRKEHTIAIDIMAFLSTADVQGNEEASRILSFVPYIDASKYALRKASNIEFQGSVAIFALALLPYPIFENFSSCFI